MPSGAVWGNVGQGVIALRSLNLGRAHLGARGNQPHGGGGDMTMRVRAILADCTDDEVLRITEILEIICAEARERVALHRLSQPEPTEPPFPDHELN